MRGVYIWVAPGSGKTYTMIGPPGLAGAKDVKLDDANAGVNLRAINELFALIETRKKEMSYEISVQMVEVYNDQIRDLLSGMFG